jgi:hypothetical protein
MLFLFVCFFSETCFSGSSLDKVADEYFNIIFNLETLSPHHVKTDMHKIVAPQQAQLCPQDQIVESAFKEVTEECIKIQSDYKDIPEISAYEEFIKTFRTVFIDLSQLTEKYNLIYIIRQFNKKTTQQLDNLRMAHSIFG